MAAARCTAWRLDVSLLQRAVAEERRRPVPRRSFHYTEPHADLNGKIQKKKEELYDLIAEADRQFTPDRQNRRLLQHLSLHVEPRPDDPEWRWLSSSTKYSTWLRRAGVTSCYLATCLIIGGEAVIIAQKRRGAEKKGLA